MKDNFLFFWRNYSANLYKPQFPCVEFHEALPEEYRAYPEIVAVFEAEYNCIIIFRNDCWAVRIHEYGHWFIWRIFQFFDAIWELLWWGLSIRALFIRKAKP